MKDRPTIRLMMASTADGKIATAAREAARFTSGEDLRRLEEEVAWADALIIAAGTVRAYGTTFRVRKPELAAERARRDQAVQPTSVVVTRSLDLPLDMPFFTVQDIPRVIATTSAAAEVARERFRGLAEVIACGEDSVNPACLIAELARRGTKNALLLGGGTLNAQMTRAGLVDELRLTIAPRLFGGKDAPTIMDGDGFGAEHAPRLKLESCEQVGDEVFLRYRVRRDG